MSWRTAFYLSSKAVDTINQYIKKLSFWKTASTYFMQTNRRKVQIILKLGNCLLDFLCPPPGCRLVKKNSSPKIWSVKSKIYEMGICYIKGPVHLLWWLTDAVKSCMGSHSIATPYLSGHTHITSTGVTLYYQPA
jgi:hypothetical protein